MRVKRGMMSYVGAASNPASPVNLSKENNQHHPFKIHRCLGLFSFDLLDFFVGICFKETLFQFLKIYIHKIHINF